MGERRGDDQMRGAGQAGQARQPHRATRIVLLSFGVGALFLLLVATVWYASGVLLLLFGSILLSVLLCDASTQLQRLVPLPYKAALLAVVALSLGILAGGAWLLEPRVSAQVNQLSDQVPVALQRLQAWLEQMPVVNRIMRVMPEPESLLDTSQLIGRAGSLFGSLVGLLGSTAVVLFVALYLAAQPQVYVDGLLMLLPARRRGRVADVLGQIASTLSHWLRGKLLTMVVVAVLTWAGLALMGLPLALTLGILAGLLDFIPYIGPILAGVPAALIAFTIDPVLVVYVALLFALVQSLESYLLMPIIERNTVSLPPALTITLQVFLGLAFGLLGVALATPVSAAMAVAIRLLYVEDVLGEGSKNPQ